jgi:hypothetical protein
MSSRDTTRAFLVSQVDGLEPFGFVTLSPTGAPLHMVEVNRREDQALEVCVPPRPMALPELSEEVRDRLQSRGFESVDAADRMKPWLLAAESSDAAAEIVLGVLEVVFEEKPDTAVDVLHGNRRAEHEARQKLAAVRERVERVISEVVEGDTVQDPEGDYLLPIGDVQVVVAPRVMPGGPSIIRVFAITNVGVEVTPELGLFLARLNFSFMFGRFTVDVEHNSIWFDETLLGDQLNEDALRFAIRVVSSTSDEWDDRLKAKFGGVKFMEAMEELEGQDPPPTKPGQGEQPGMGLYL